MATYLQLCQRVRQETGTAGTGPTTVESQKGQLAQIVGWVAQAYLDICNKWDDWQFLWAEDSLTCASDQADYTLSGDLKQINEDSLYLSGGILGTDRQRVTHVPYDDYRRDKHFHTGTGIPSQFTIKPDGKIKLLPTPNAAYTLEYEYWKLATPLTTNSQLPLFHANFHDAIVWKAVMYWAGFNEAEAEFQKAVFHFDRAMMRLEAKALPAKDQMHSRAEGVDIVVVPE